MKEGLEKWTPVFPRDKCEAFARRSRSNSGTEGDGFSKKKRSGSRFTIGEKGRKIARPELAGLAG
jgi:hypothetical protein